MSHALFDEFDFNSLPPPEDIAWPLYPEDSPARLDTESTAAFNEDAARAAFGDACIEAIKKQQTKYRGDWWMLAFLFRCVANAEHRNPTRSDKDRFVQLSLVVFDLNFRKYFIHMEYARLWSLQAEHIHLVGVCLAHAEFVSANLKHAKMFDADFEHAVFVRTDLKFTSIGFANLKRANLRDAHVQHARLERTSLEHANLLRTRLEHAGIHLANLDHANVRGATGILFNDNAVKRLDIEGTAPDPWSVLRRTYTGPKYFLNLLLLVAFVLPYAAKVLTLTTIDRGADAARAALASDRLPAPSADAAAAWLDAFDATHTDIPAIWVLLGGSKGW